MTWANLALIDSESLPLEHEVVTVLIALVPRHLRFSGSSQLESVLCGIDRLSNDYHIVVHLERARCDLEITLERTICVISQAKLVFNHLFADTREHLLGCTYIVHGKSLARAHKSDVLVRNDFMDRMML